MSIAWRELTRRTGRFVPALVAITMLVLLLVVLAGFLDGLSRSQTGVLRAQGDRLLVLAGDAELAPDRSQVPADVADAVRAVEGVAQVGRLSTVPTTARVDGTVEDVVLVGHDLATEQVPAPAEDGGALVDRRLTDLVDVTVGGTVAVGPGPTDLAATALVDDVSAGAPTVWVPWERWQRLASEVDPTGPAAIEVLVVEGSASAEAIREAAGEVAVATVADVIAADETVSQQTTTFTGIIAVTFVVTLLVVALFFVLLTIQRVRLHAVLKAVGARTRDLVAGLALQAAVVSVAAVGIGFALAQLLLRLVPPDLPIVVLPGRLLVVGLTTVVVAVLGALTTLRRMLRVDPADAIG